MLDIRFYDRTIIHEDEERMIPLGVKMMLDITDDPRVSSICVRLKW